jgi:alpha-tubulin suppressor-like RCC1 family protein
MATPYTPNVNDLTQPQGGSPAQMGATEILLIKEQLALLLSMITALASGGTPFPYPITSAGIAAGAILPVALAPATLALLPAKFASFPEFHSKSHDTDYVTWMVDSNGQLVGWGTNENNTLGDGSDVSNAPRYRYVRPVFNVPLPSGTTVKELHVCEGNILALFSNGWIYGCGPNTNGQLGVGDSVARTIFTRIEFFVTNVITPTTIIAHGAGLYVGGGSAAALDTNGKVYTWGQNDSGQLGQGDLVNRTTPTLIATGLPGGYVATKIYGHMGTNGMLFVILNSGALYGCGYNGQGALGLGNVTTPINTLTIIPTVFSSAISKIIAVASFTSTPVVKSYSFVLTTDGHLYATGINDAGQLGQGNTTQLTTHTLIATLAGIIDIIISGGGSQPSCYAIENLITGGRVWSWGYGVNGQLGQNGTVSLSTPTLIAAWSGAGAPPWNTFVQQIIPVGYCYVASTNPGAIILTTTGTLYSAGDDTSYSLGQNAAAATLKFTPLNLPSLLPGEIFTSGYCQSRSQGTTTLVFLMTNQGNVYSIGANDRGAAYVNDNAVASARQLAKLPALIS